MKILRCKEVEKKLSIGHSKIYRMIEENQFPRPIKLGPKSVGWLESEIDEWVQEKIDERDEVTV